MQFDSSPTSTSKPTSRSSHFSLLVAYLSAVQCEITRGNWRIYPLLVTTSQRLYKTTLRQPHSHALAVAARRICGSCNNNEDAVRSTYGHRTVSLWSPHRTWCHELYDCCLVAVMLVTTTTAACKSVQLQKVPLTNRTLQDCTAFIRRQHDMWPRQYQVSQQIPC